MAVQFSILIITRNRASELEEVLECLQNQTFESYEVILIDNGSSEEFRDRIRSIGARYPRVQYFMEERNHGVSGGRALGMTRCTGKVVVELDDDALVHDPTFLDRLNTYLDQNPGVGIVAFKITNFFTQTVSRWEYPFLDKRRNVDLPGDACWFIGCGHAIRSEVIAKIGVYRDFFPYSQEELDFSYRTLDAGYRIAYAPEFEVLHKKSQAGREHYAQTFWILQLKNRIKLAALNLPCWCVVTMTVVRGAQYSVLARNVLVLPRALAAVWKEREYIRSERKRLKPETIAYLRRMKGPLFV